jgi:ABC-type branched-subunit amino acid transport system substrate-binding protein
MTLRRRDFLKTLGTTAALGLLAACGGGGAASSPAAPASKPASAAPASSAAASAPASPAASAAASASAKPAASAAAAAKPSGISGTIKLGILTDLTGPYAALGKSLLNNIQLAADEINAVGNPKVDLVVEDTATDPKTSVEKATKVTQSDKVVAVLGIISSAAREAVRPTICDRAKLPFIYTTPYEGGDCNPNLLTAGHVPNQSIEPYLPWLIQNHGKKMYLFGADYVWPRTMFKITRDIVAKSGGTVVGEEYAPLTATEFSALLPKVKASGADVFVSAFPVPAWTNVVQLLTDSGLRNNMHIATYFMSDPFADAIPANIRDGISTENSYWYDVPLDANKKYLDAYHKKFGPNEPTELLGVGGYVGMHLYVNAVRQAGTTATDPLRPALEQSTFKDGPGGPVAFTKNHHTTMNMYIATIKGGKFKIDKTLEQLQPNEPCKF